MGLLLTRTDHALEASGSGRPRGIKESLPPILFRSLAFSGLNQYSYPDSTVNVRIRGIGAMLPLHDGALKRNSSNVPMERIS